GIDQGSPSSVVGQASAAYGVFGYSGAPAGQLVNSPTGQPPGTIAVAGGVGTSAGKPGVYGISGPSIGGGGQERDHRLDGRARGRGGAHRAGGAVPGERADQGQPDRHRQLPQVGGGATSRWELSPPVLPGGAGAVLRGLRPGPARDRPGDGAARPGLCAAGA